MILLYYKISNLKRKVMCFFMVKRNDISEYNIIGTLNSDNNCDIWIASKKDPEDSNFYLINRFAHNKNNLWIFKTFFSYFSSKKHCSDMVDFFAVNGYFYIIFKYSKAECIIDRYEKETLTENFEQRCNALSNILIKLNNISSLPVGALVNASMPENICIDNDDKVQIIYTLYKIDEKASMLMVYRNIASIIKLMLDNELKNRYDQHLPIVIEKCNNGIYRSIPELIVDLENAEKKCHDGGALSSLMKFFKGHKKQVKKYGIIAGISLGIIFILYLLYSMILKPNKTSDVQEVSVGIINYNSDNQYNIDTTIDVDSIISPNTGNSDEIVDLYISPSTDIASDDYIVQYGDTLESICDEFYSSRSFISTIQGFNSITSNAQLTAGLVIKLPDETAVRTMLSAY